MDCDTDGDSSEEMLSAKTCPPCMDVVIESTDLDILRPFDARSVEVPLFVAVKFLTPTPDAFLKPEAPRNLENPTRGPPPVEPACVLIRRTSVLRI